MSSFNYDGLLIRAFAQHGTLIPGLLSSLTVLLLQN